MKILAFVDLHGSKKTMLSLKRKAKEKEVDCVICAGDFTIFGNDEHMMIREFDTFGKPVFVVHGNHEELGDMRKSCERSKNVVFIHKAVVEFNGFKIVGWGGGGFSSLDKEFEKFYNGLNLKKDDKIILVTHAPPYNTKIDHIYEQSAGNKSVRKFIERFSPLVAISGHLHENSGKLDKINKTVVINPGHEGKVLDV